MKQEITVNEYIDPGTGFTVVTIGGWFIAVIAGLFGIIGIFFKSIAGFFKRNRFTLSILIALIIIVSVLMIGVNHMHHGASFDKKIIILGFDGLSPHIVRDLMGQGRLPHFEALQKKGSFRELKTTNPSQSPVAWTGFATGQNPGKNGVFDFIKRDPQSYNLSLTLSDEVHGKPKRPIKTTCFWEYVSERKIPSAIISCPVTYPPHKIYGTMLSGMGVPDIIGTQGTFTFYTTKPIDTKKDIGGRVVQIMPAPQYTLDLIGPRVIKQGGKRENVTVPLSVRPAKDTLGIVIEYQGHTVTLAPGEWSDWQEVSFDLGFLKKASGIFRFYLNQLTPHFELYISPINFNPRNPLFPISYPSGYSNELADHIGLFYTQGMPIDTWAVNEKRLGEKPHLEQIREVMREKKAMLDYELARLQNGLLFCYFESPDIIQHMFWRYRDQKHPLYEPDAPQEYKDIINEWYVHMDNILGDVMSRIQDDDVIIVLSDHGFNTFRRSVHVNAWLREHGYLVLKNPEQKETDGLLTGIDWNQTTAYAIGFGAIYLNQKGRESGGIIAPGTESESLKDEISEKLLSWHDTKYQQPIINRVYKREEIFWGPESINAPDLYIGFNIGYRASWQTAIGAVPKKLIEDNMKKWSGSHLFDPQLIDGILLTNRPVTKEKPSIYDIAPTVLTIIGFDTDTIRSCRFDGSSLFQED
ncbi:MAG: hypothetical protein GF384_09115 [Elusimicrobia bacterium]|nr:hypothetical protein [Elusimicrobiota bacterium]MBD3412745.1 hypothetical protein [Elusimicrobiota bacterium]